MSVASIFNKLGQKTLPRVLKKAFPDTMKVLRAAEASDSAGGTTETLDTIFDYEDIVVPCAYEPNQYEFEAVVGNTILSRQQYTVTFPTHLEGPNPVRIDVRPSDLLEVQERGNEPVKTFKITALKNYMGVSWDATCELEN